MSCGLIKVAGLFTEVFFIREFILFIYIYRGVFIIYKGVFVCFILFETGLWAGPSMCSLKPMSE